MSIQKRQPAGQPIGGQFAATARAESAVTLGQPAGPGLLVVPDCEAKVTESRRLDDQAVLGECNARYGVREIRDVTAIAIARTLGARGDSDTTELNRLASEGQCDREGVTAEIAYIYRNDLNATTRTMVNMFGTWIINGGED